MLKFSSYRDFNNCVWEIVKFIKYKKPLSPKYARLWESSSKESVEKIPAWDRSQSDLKKFIGFALGIEKKEEI